MAADATIPFEAVCAEITVLDAAELERWVSRRWVRPVGGSGRWLFREADVARVRLLVELHQLELGEAAMPVVLSLLDQLYEERGRLRRLRAALEQVAPSDLRAALLHHIHGVEQ